ncbi:hypothetical protein TNIN_210731 [Trichonephila inaurata madagascariensis]|uniref:Uncharacterized protein n=1 Tax=Trichonephila inaurata madagascariensis TaxID=2747483 RepID=A0A8X6YMC2_9ARAC|nr:hypothetical protein TNIN_210731 [Trichonephila inaurata madagascariensis]
MRGLMDGAVARKPVQHFLMSVVRLKTLFWEIERDAKRSDHLWPQPETGERLLIYATSAINSQRTLPSDRAYAPSVSSKGMECVSECPTQYPRPRPKLP